VVAAHDDSGSDLLDFGVSVGWRMHLEDVGGTVVADTAALHLALPTAEHNRLASGLCQPRLMDDPAPGRGARNVDGRISLPDGPGLGLAPDEDWLGTPEAVFDRKG
jgi:L-alanine-DL-glutamate epimerase-like enolase superfamily enzyme